MPKGDKSERKTKSTEKAVRAILQRHVQQFTRVLLTPACHANIEEHAYQMLAFVEFLKKEARRKTRSKPYLEFRERLLNKAASEEIGSLASLRADNLHEFERMLQAIVGGFGNKGLPFDKLDPTAFLSIQNTLLIPRKKRGPRYKPNYDDAFKRSLNESVAEIARDLEPDAFNEDPVGTIQRYSTAFERRRKK